MYVPLQLYHYDLFILMRSLFLRVLFLEVLFHMVMWRGVHTPTKYVCGASLCVGVLEQESAEQVQDKLCTCILKVYLCPASARHLADVGSMLGRVV